MPEHTAASGTNVLNAIFGFLRSLAGRGPNVRVFISETGYWRWKVKTDGFKPGWIIIHHSASIDGVTRDWDAIRKYHMSYRHQGNIISKERYEELRDAGKLGLETPWSDVGYHFGIEEVDGKVVVHNGRPVGEIGAHCVGFNSKSIGICFVGNYDKEPPSSDKLFFGVSLCRQLMKQFRIPRDQVIGHRESYPLLKGPVVKTCPGSAFDMDAFRQRLPDMEA